MNSVFLANGVAQFSKGAKPSPKGRRPPCPSTAGCAPVAVAGELVVAGKCDVDAESRTNRIEDLYRCVYPHLQTCLYSRSWVHFTKAVL